MTQGNPFTPSFEQLPEAMPVFPLPGALLLPRGHMPLNIFEPRYLAMTAHALGQPHRTIGMIQPRSEGSTMKGTPDLFETGCAGRITSFAETDDGRFLITLTGVCRFHIAEELPADPTGFRLVRPDFSAYRTDLDPVAGQGRIDRDRLRTVLETYFDQNKIRACWETIAETDDETLVTSLAMACAFQPMEKQALLESDNLYDRCQTLIALLEMSVHDGDAAGRASN
jgi:Lon protease-like protein